MRFAGFDWDDGNRMKISKHGLSPEQVDTVLLGDIHVAPDPAHSQSEARFKAVGQDSFGRHVFIVFTLRHFLTRTVIRPKSARYMHRKEVRKYEEDISRSHE